MENKEYLISVWKDNKQLHEATKWISVNQAIKEWEQQGIEYDYFKVEKVK